ncbi:hypothetical protein D8674_039889 [Pyrus ussuriensis x Pyrus communis]|uniref:DUF1279 domain-containing protein n=1 Tax=Pyrus ussuriensis x Pyrus communis TaxID=2448454 RepID=A0A5N5FC32_9ROSA|nr:hypothetical protein D8674_039889 [Pyrus ussuriensis x Pyrus communis]
MASVATGGRFKELLKKYGKVALGVHFSVSAASITGLYVAIKNNVDVESLLDKLHMGSVSSKDENPENPPVISDGSEFRAGPISENGQSTAVVVEKERSRTAELAASTGGALALALLCNKALFPIRVPITLALTPPVARFLARRRLIKTGGL